MITSRFPLGDVSFTAGYFSTLVGEATKHCYGVAAMAPRDMTDAVRSLVHGSDYSEKGVRVTQENGRLVIELHIAVSYGLNISTAARSISHRVKDEVRQCKSDGVSADCPPQYIFGCRGESECAAAAADGGSCDR